MRWVWPLVIAILAGCDDERDPQPMPIPECHIIELEASEDDEVVILANNFKVATGAVIVSGNRIAVEVKEMAPKSPDVR